MIELSTVMTLFVFTSTLSNTDRSTLLFFWAHNDGRGTRTQSAEALFTSTQTSHHTNWRGQIDHTTTPTARTDLTCHQWWQQKDSTRIHRESESRTRAQWLRWTAMSSPLIITSIWTAKFPMATKTNWSKRVLPGHNTKCHTIAQPKLTINGICSESQANNCLIFRVLIASRMWPRRSEFTHWKNKSCSFVRSYNSILDPRSRKVVVWCHKNLFLESQASVAAGCGRELKLECHDKSNS